MKKLLLGILLLISSTAIYAVDVTYIYTWDASPAVTQTTHYQCEYELNGGQFTSCGADIIPPLTSTEGSLPGLSPNDVLTAHVRACNVVGCSSYTTGVSAVVPTDAVPGAPTGEGLGITVQ